jgi:hypothetical protein
MQLAWLSLALITTVGYHLVMKVTPATVNPFLSLAASYSLGAAVFLACFALAPDGPTLREGLKLLNWTALALTLMVVGLDVGFPDALPLGLRRKPRADRHAVRRRTDPRGRGHCPVSGKDHRRESRRHCAVRRWAVADQPEVAARKSQ